MNNVTNNFHGPVNQNMQGSGMQTHFVEEPKPHAIYGMPSDSGIPCFMEVVGYMVGVELTKDGKKKSVGYPVCRKVWDYEPAFYSHIEIVGTSDKEPLDYVYMGRENGDVSFRTLSQLIYIDKRYGDAEATPLRVGELLEAEFGMTLTGMHLNKTLTIECFFDDEDGKMEVYAEGDKGQPSFLVKASSVWKSLPVTLAEQMRDWNDFFGEEKIYMPKTFRSEEQPKMDELWSLAADALVHIRAHGESSNLENAAIACRRIGNTKFFYDDLELATQKEYLGDAYKLLERFKEEGLVESTGNIFKFNELVEKLANFKDSMESL